MADEQPSIEKKIESLKDSFSRLSPEEKIQYLLKLGRSLPLLPDKLKIPTNKVAGCQSILYLASRLDDGKIIFCACADALLSAGLAALLISVYSDELPQTILNTPPNFLVDCGILSTLTPSRSNGLAHIHQRMKADALKFLVSSKMSGTQSSVILK